MLIQGSIFITKCFFCCLICLSVVVNHETTIFIFSLISFTRFCQFRFGCKSFRIGHSGTEGVELSIINSLPKETPLCVESLLELNNFLFHVITYYGIQGLFTVCDVSVTSSMLQANDVSAEEIIRHISSMEK